MTKKTILIVDYDQLFVEFLTNNLKEAGYNIVAAPNGQIGLDLIKLKKPNLIISEVFMPIMDGFELYKILKENKKTSDIPFLVITKRKMMKNSFLALGVNGFISKPCPPENVLLTVKSIIAPKVLVLSDNNHAIEVIEEALLHNGFKAAIVKNENTLLKAAKMISYKFIIIHLPFLKENPEKFIEIIKQFKHKEPKIIIYSDVYVKGTGKGDTIAINELRTKWESFPNFTFYDARIIAADFSTIFREYINKQ